MASRIKRSLFGTLMNVDPSGTPDYQLMGPGITDMSADYGANTDTVTYIHEDSATTELMSYAPTMPFSQQIIDGDPVSEFVDNLRRTRAVGEAAQTDIIMLYNYDPASTATSIPAEQQVVSVEIGSFGGAGGEMITMDGTLNFVGEGVLGTYNPATSTFTTT